MKYKIGDKVRVKSVEWYNKNKNKHGSVSCDADVTMVPAMAKLCNCIVTIERVYNYTYKIKESKYQWTDDMFEDLVFENIVFPNENYADKVELCLGNDYEIVVEDNRTFIQKKKPKYPKTFIEVLNFWHPDRQIEDDYQIYYKKDLIEKFQNLLYARDAYWKIAGEEMGLGKSWEPDWEKSDSGYVYCIVNKCNNIGLTCEWIRNNHILSFPTAEMRDAFYDNFKSLIEDCKEFL